MNWNNFCFPQMCYAKWCEAHGITLWLKTWLREEQGWWENLAANEMERKWRACQDCLRVSSEVWLVLKSFFLCFLYKSVHDKYSWGICCLPNQCKCQNTASVYLKRQHACTIRVSSLKDGADFEIWVSFLLHICPASLLRFTHSFTFYTHAAQLNWKLEVVQVWKQNV